ncbi:hypothetical protein GYMLUDRAFT_244559 [Collybiopsis luxurians FD-317 M1]|uniref:Uncharacterized protein n=1 Tax=Collybiopsis luxurians FD-317 M1 TaxID=944289 RepID=A0A0D0CC85_9AGAR|nr:hypothetical protein GYMLUDRAFT_244559 [Collybiopsis luxurians FD-317 M1]
MPKLIYVQNHGAHRLTSVSDTSYYFKLLKRWLFNGVGSGNGRCPGYMESLELNVFSGEKAKYYRQKRLEFNSKPTIEWVACPRSSVLASLRNPSNMNYGPTPSVAMELLNRLPNSSPTLILLPQPPPPQPVLTAPLPDPHLGIRRFLGILNDSRTWTRSRNEYREQVYIKTLGKQSSECQAQGSEAREMGEDGGESVAIIQREGNDMQVAHHYFDSLARPSSKTASPTLLGESTTSYASLLSQPSDASFSMEKEIWSEANVSGDP